MPVYVDNPRNPLGRMKMCHMIADTFDELWQIAYDLDLKEEWFQRDASFPHFDISLSKRRQAVALGAIECTSRELVTHLRRIRDELNRDIEDGIISPKPDYQRLKSPRYCLENPEKLKGVPLGQYHCPYCGQMQVAGVPAIMCQALEIDDG